MISIGGRLAEDARALRTRDGRSVLQLLIAVPHDGAARSRPVRLRVVQDLGAGESAAYSANARAWRLRRGTSVVVHGSGLQWVRGAVALQGVTRIDEPGLRARNVTGERDA